MDKNREQDTYRAVTNKLVRNPLIRILLMAGGTLSVGLGILGIFLPLLPTTSFLLLAAYLYYRSSPRMHTWLMYRSPFSKYLQDYAYRKLIPVRIKVYTIALLWITLGISGIWATDNIYIRIILALVGIGVSWHILSYRSKT